MDASVAVATGIGGKRSRDGKPQSPNEDAVLACGWLTAADRPTRAVISTDTSEPVLLLVADGMGGHSHGERASREVAQYLSTRLSNLTSETALVAELTNCHAKLVDIMTNDARTTGMGTTIAALIVHGERGVVFNVGDSRVYRQRNGRLHQLSVDHVAQPVSTKSARLTQCIGGTNSLDVQLQPNVRVLESLGHGDRFMLCSDGLTDKVGDGTIEQVLADVSDPVDAAHVLYDLALEAETPDNVSILVLDLKYHSTEESVRSKHRLWFWK